MYITLFTGNGVSLVKNKWQEADFFVWNVDVFSSAKCDILASCSYFGRDVTYRMIGTDSYVAEVVVNLVHFFLLMDLDSLFGVFLVNWFI